MHALTVQAWLQDLEDACHLSKRKRPRVRGVYRAPRPRLGASDESPDFPVDRDYHGPIKRRRISSSAPGDINIRAMSPPTTGTDKSRSPRRRIRVDSDDDNLLDNPLSTPKARRNTKSSSSFALASSSYEVASSHFSLALRDDTTLPPPRKKASRRPDSRSPSKSPTRPNRLLDLRLLRRPVILTVDPQYNLPNVVAELHTALEYISRDRSILPDLLKERIVSCSGRTTIFPEAWGRPRSETVNPSDELFDLMTELRSIEDIVGESHRAVNAYSEVHWNETVHYPALKLALRHCRTVEVHNITSARLAKAFRPRFQVSDDNPDLTPFETASSTTGTDATGTEGGEESKAGTYHKMVDYALVLNPEHISNVDDQQTTSLSTLIAKFLAAQPRTEACINAISYEPLTYLPAVVAIETKTESRTARESHLQLGVWIAAWHERLRKLVEPAALEDRRDETVIPVPVIRVMNSEWTVEWAVHEVAGVNGDCIRIVGPPLSIGSTHTVVGTYRLMAALRSIALWLETTFANWFYRLVKDTLLL